MIKLDQELGARISIKRAGLENAQNEICLRHYFRTLIMEFCIFPAENLEKRLRIETVSPLYPNQIEL